jgi:primosomal protein N' (replication factor Y)
MYAAVFPLVRTRAFTEPFDYLVPPGLPDVRIGSLVAVPLGGQVVLGVVVGMAATSSHSARALPLNDVVDLPPLPADLVTLAGRVRDYYLTSLGSALALVAPPGATLRLDRTAALTEEGERRLAEGQDELSAYVRPAPLKGALRDDPQLARLRREGAIEIAYRVRLTEAEREPRCLAIGAQQPRRPGVRQRAALELLAQVGSCDERSLLADSGLAPAGLERLLQAGAIRVLEEGACAAPAAPAQVPPQLLPEQQAALSQVLDGVGEGREILLHGVTGSGKTEVYLRAAAEVLAQGHTVLLLVPEISLTGQTISRVRRRFPDQNVAVFHSSLSAGERLAAYRAAAGGQARIVIGARSAVFAPLSDLGLIIVDEEHDSSYKQESEPRYDARSVARWRAELSGAALVFGSATPRVETWATARVHADLPRRVDGSLPPRLEVIDLRDIHSVLSQPLRAALLGCLEAGDKAILFLNRRGIATSVSCGHCGHTWLCPRCDVSLSLFRGGRELRCRTCGYHVEAPQQCPQCAGVDVGRHGVGTERLEAEVGSLLPGIELMRLDSDVASSYARLRGVLDRFAAPGAKVLVGTQMIAKGHHFPEVTLVGVINADLSLFFPDFRAEERTYSMLMQVGGRAGRGEHPGRVLVQTLNPQARPIAMAAAGEHEEFYAGELERRRLLGYPPASTLIGLEASSPDARTAGGAAAYLANAVRAGLKGGEEVIGPSPLRRARGRYEARVMVKTTETGKTIPALTGLVARVGPRLRARGARLVADVEPEWS